MKAAASRSDAAGEGGALGGEQQLSPPRPPEDEEEEYVPAAGLRVSLTSGGSAGSNGASPRVSGASPRASGASPRASCGSGTSPLSAGVSPLAAGAAAERLTLAQLLTILEEGRLVEGVAAEREAGVQLEELESSEATDPEELERQTMQAQRRWKWV